MENETIAIEDITVVSNFINVFISDYGTDK